MKKYNPPEEKVSDSQSEVKNLLYWILFLNIAILGFLLGMFVSYVLF